MEIPKASKLHHKLQNKAVTILTQSNLFFYQRFVFSLSQALMPYVLRSVIPLFFFVVQKKRQRDKSKGSAQKQNP